MGMRADMKEGLSDMFDTMGEDAVFVPAEGASVPCKVFIDYNRSEAPQGFDIQVAYQGITIEANLQQIGREPVKDETFILEDGTFKVIRTLSNDSFTIKLAVKEG